MTGRGEMNRDEQIQVQGMRIHIIAAGEAGSPVLLLHGGGTDSARLSWSLAIPALASSHRVFAPDLPGYGESERPPARYNTGFYLDFIQGLMDALHLEHASLAGLSMGGALALGTALDTPARVDRLALVDSYGLQRTVAMQKLSYLMVKIPGIMESTWAGMRLNRGMAKAGMANVFHDLNRISDDLLDDIFVEARKPHAGRAFTAYQREEVLWNGLRTVYLDRLGEIRIPTLIIHGRQDRAVPLIWAKMANERITGSRLEVIDGAGHWPQREQPEQFNRILVEFLKDS
ncbi:MAG: alpha/beta fold hydrolase [Omnitrophica WOR_2 bacterium]